jgi:MazG nucleotide pyrophosphohydrolase domain
VAGAIEEENWDGLKDELGDLLFQVVFHARMAEERGLFDFGNVVAAVTDKMVRRHPHVFADLAGIDTAEAQVSAWESHKARERAEKPEASLLDDVPRALPALTRALKLQKRAAGQDRGRNRRPAVRGGEPRPPPQSAAGGCPARGQREVLAPLPLHRAKPSRARQIPARYHAR